MKKIKIYTMQRDMMDLTLDQIEKKQNRTIGERETFTHARAH